MDSSQEKGAAAVSRAPQRRPSRSGMSRNVPSQTGSWIREIRDLSECVLV